MELKLQFNNFNVISNPGITGNKKLLVITLFLFPLNPEFILFFIKFEVIIQIILYFNAQANPGTKPHRWL